MFQHIFSEDVFIISKGNQFKGTHYPLRCHLTAFIYKWIGVGFELNYNTFSFILEDILTLPRDLSSFLTHASAHRETQKQQQEGE